MRKDRKDYPINQPYGEEGVILLYDGRRLEEPTITRASNLVILNNVR